MHQLYWSCQWYWSCQYLDFFNCDNAFDGFDCLYEQSNGIVLESSSNVDPLPADLSTSGASEINSPSTSITNSGPNPNDRVDSSQLDAIYNKIKAQFDFNKSKTNRRFNVYSNNFPVDMQLTGSEECYLHQHLINLDESYDLRQLKTQIFRMYRNRTTNAAISASEELLRHMSIR